MMARMILPPVEPIPNNVTQRQREEMFVAYCRLLVRMNPGAFLPQGVKRRWWNFGKLEHPLTNFCGVREKQS